MSHPETGAATTLERVRRVLLSPAGLDAATAEVLGANPNPNRTPTPHPHPDPTPSQVLGALSGDNVLLFHLLGRGDSSWRGRDAILAQLQRLPPIAAPSSLFQAACHLLLTTYYSPLTTRHLLLTSYHSPLTTHHLPLATYHLPLATSY